MTQVATEQAHRLDGGFVDEEHMAQSVDPQGQGRHAREQDRGNTMRLNFRDFGATVAMVALVLVSAGAWSETATATATSAQAPQSPQQRVAMLKQWLQASQAQLRRYEWIETTVISKGGEEKSRKQDSCYYGVDGTLQKVPLAGATQEASAPHGPLRKRIAANKKEEVQQYMHDAVTLVHQYVPPDPNRIQQAVNAGNFSVSPQAQRARLTFRNYLKPNDELHVDVDIPTNRLLGVSVASYLDDAKDPIQLDVGVGVLPDGTIYTQRSTLSAPAKELTVTVENSGHRQTGG